MALPKVIYRPGDSVSSPGISPAWAETTVRWLREKAPHCVSRLESKPFTEQLFNALVKLGYLHKEMVADRGFADLRWRQALDQMANTWTKPKFEQLKTFITKGKIVSTEPITVTTPEGTFDLSLDGDEDEEDVEELARLSEDVLDTIATLKPRPEHSPQHDLEEAVAEEMKLNDPRYGTW